MESAMDQDRRHQIDAWLQAALDLDDESERSRLLDRECPDELRNDVDRLLTACANPDALPPVERMRIEALYDLQMHDLQRPESDESGELDLGPLSPWSL